MRLYSWLRHHTCGERPPSATRPPLRCETLEARDVPATLPVTSVLDDPTQRGTLRYAVAHAGDGDTILLTGAAQAGITLTQGELLLRQQNLTIRSASALNPVAVSGNHLSRVFEVAAGASVTLANLIVTGGTGLTGNPDDPHEGRGGGVVVDEGATLTVTGGTVTDNAVHFVTTSDGRTVGGLGGGIADYGTLKIDGSSVSGNQAMGTFGGGIAVFSGAPFSPPFTATLAITNSRVSGNTAQQNGGGIAGVASTVTVDHCVVTGNTATKFNGGGLVNRYGTLTVSHSRVDDNKAARYGEGGGLFNDGTDWAGSHFVSTLTVTDCDVDGNSAGFGAGVYSAGTLALSDSRLTTNFALGDWGYGGGVLTDYGTTATLRNDVITGNSANFGGGVWSAGTTTISASKIDNNRAASAGGGIITESGSLTVESSEVDNNDNSTGWGGGGIFVDYGTVTLSHCDISGNTTGWGGGGIFNYDALTLTDCTLSGNTAAGDGGGVLNYGTVTADHCTVSGNSAGSGGGGIANWGSLAVSNSTFIANTPDNLRNFGAYTDGGGNTFS